MVLKQRISFIVPALNSERTIQSCLSSILQQNYPSELIDVVVVDNGSCDATVALASAFGKVRLVHEPVRGRSRARNRGAAETTSPLLAFVDSDVVLPPEWAKELSPLLLSPTVVAAQGPIGLRYSNLFIQSFPKKFRRPNIFADPLAMQILDTAAVLVTRLAFDKANGFDEKLKRWEDADFTMKLLQTSLGIASLEGSLVTKTEDRNFIDWSRRSFDCGFTFWAMLSKWWGNPRPLSFHDCLVYALEAPSWENALFWLGFYLSSPQPSEYVRKFNVGWKPLTPDSLMARDLRFIFTSDFLMIYQLSKHNEREIFHASTEAYRRYEALVLDGQGTLREFLQYLDQGRGQYLREH